MPSSWADSSIESRHPIKKDNVINIEDRPRKETKADNTKEEKGNAALCELDS